MTRFEKREIMDVKTWMFEKKKNMLDGHAEKQDNERSGAIEKSIKNLSHSSPQNASELFILTSPFQMSIWRNSLKIGLGYLQSNGKKKIEVYHSLLMMYTRLFPILIQNQGISVQTQKIFHIQRDMILMSDVSIIVGLSIVQGQSSSSD